MSTRDRIADARGRTHECEALAGTILAAAPRFGPGVELRSLVAAARARLKPARAENFALRVRAATIALEQSWRLTRVPGAHPVRWRRLDAEDSLRFAAPADDGNRWPPL